MIMTLQAKQKEEKKKLSMYHTMIMIYEMYMIKNVYESG